MVKRSSDLAMHGPKTMLSSAPGRVVLRACGVADLEAPLQEQLLDVAAAEVPGDSLQGSASLRSGGP
jgi:hypothetical protein